MSEAKAADRANPLADRANPLADRANPLQPVLFEVKRTIVGQDILLERMAIALLSGGHLLVEGVPGLAKTLSVKSLAAAIGGQFQRIQFTPDLVPADLTGTRVYHQHSASSRPSSARFSRTCCWPTRSTARPPRCRAPCSRSCRSTR